MNELKPCPFCGGEARFMVKVYCERGNMRGWEFGINCTRCNITTSKTDYVLEVQLKDDGEIGILEDERCQAVEAWNRRADNAAD